jgi:outer membrane lipoprotein carrier protein
MRKNVAAVVTGLAVLLAGSAPPVAAQAPTAAELARRIQAHYNAVADFSADFVATFKYELTHQVSVERGTLKVKKPNRMRWTFTKPDRKEFVADGTKLYSYFPADRVGTENLMSEVSDNSLALLFLAGKGDLVRDFTASMPADQPAGEWRLVLSPKKQQEEYDTLTLGVRRDSLALTALEILDEEGTQTYQFTDFKTNRGLKDSDFRFVFPPGTVKR